MCDPSILPVMAPEIQNACLKFPSKAEAIVKQNGLELNEFNKLLDKTKNNIFFRFRVMLKLKSMKKNS